MTTLLFINQDTATEVEEPKEAPEPVGPEVPEEETPEEDKEEETDKTPEEEEGE